MNTLTKTAAKGKSKRGERSLRISNEVNGLRALSLTKDSQTVNYYLREIPVDFGAASNSTNSTPKRRPKMTASITFISTTNSVTAALARVSAMPTSANTSTR